jgi:hypothetical protein
MALAWLSIRILLVCGSLPKGARGAPIGLISACQGGALWFLVFLLITPWGRDLTSWWGNLSGLLLISRTCERSRSVPCHTPLEEVMTYGNHDLWWKCTTYAECKTIISAVPSVMSGLNPFRDRWFVGWFGWWLILMLIILSPWELRHNLAT